MGRTSQAEETAVSPRGEGECLRSSNARAESSLDFKAQAFPKQEVKKIRLCKNAICGQFFKRTDVLSLVWWFAVSGNLSLASKLEM